MRTSSKARRVPMPERQRRISEGLRLAWLERKRAALRKALAESTRTPWWHMNDSGQYEQCAAARAAWHITRLCFWAGSIALTDTRPTAPEVER